MKKRTLLILIAAIVLFLLLAFIVIRTIVNDTLGPRVERASAAFTEGVMASDGSTAQSLSDALYQRLAASDRLQTLAAKFDEVYPEYTNLRNAHNALLDPLKNGGSFEDMKAADGKLTEAYQKCYDALGPLVSGKNASTREQSAAELDAAAEAVTKAAESYNSYIRSFRSSTLNRFPNSILKIFLQMDEPQLWP